MGSDFSQYHQEQARQAAFNNAMEFQRQQTARQAEQDRHLSANRQMYAERQRQQQTIWIPRTSGGSYPEAGAFFAKLCKFLALVLIAPLLLAVAIMVVVTIVYKPSVVYSGAPTSYVLRRTWHGHRRHFRHHHSRSATELVNAY